MAYSWYKSYRAAVLETDWTTMQERIQAAESELLGRQSALSEGDPIERLEVAEALENLGVLRKPALKHAHRTDGGGGLTLVK
jgi:hypothetical protein